MRLQQLVPLLFTLFAATLILTGCGGSENEPTPPKKERTASEVVRVPGWKDINLPLSFAIKARGTVYASGLQGIIMNTTTPVEGGIQAETLQALGNLKELLNAAGARMEDVLRCSVSLVNISRDFKGMNEAYATFWPKDPPARVAVQVASLGKALVEIQCDAALPGQNRSVVKVPGFPDLAAKGFPLSFATKSDGMVYLSGSQGIDMATMKIVPGGVAAETTQTLKNLKQVLEAAGSSTDQVVGCSISLRNISDFAKMNEAYEAFWPKSNAMGGLPSRVCVEVSSLAGEGVVEIECTAATSDIASDKAPKVVKVPGWPDMPNLPFSAAVTAGGVAYISGNQGVDMKTMKRVEGGAGPETTQTLRNIQEAAAAAGAALEDVLRCDVSLVDLKDFEVMNAAYALFWPKDPPSRVTVQVGALAMGANVEIRCAAAMPAAAKQFITTLHDAELSEVVV